MAVVSRRRLASRFAADVTTQTYSDMVQQLAAYLIDTKQVKHLELFVSDIEAELAKDGEVIVDVTTAKPLTDASRMQAQEYAKKMLGASLVTLREHVDEALIGGIVIRAQGQELDASVKSQLRQLRTR